MLTVSVLALTVAPELGLEPAWSRNHGPAFGAVSAALRLPEAHGRKHVRHVVAREAQIDLRARLEAKQRGEQRCWSSRAHLEEPILQHRPSNPSPSLFLQSGCYRNIGGLGGVPGSPRPGRWGPGHSQWGQHTACRGRRGQSSRALQWSCRPSLQDRSSSSSVQEHASTLAWFLRPGSFTCSVPQVHQQLGTSQHGLAGHLKNKAGETF